MYPRSVTVRMLQNLHVLETSTVLTLSLDDIRILKCTPKRRQERHREFA